MRIISISFLIASNASHSTTNTTSFLWVLLVVPTIHICICCSCKFLPTSICLFVMSFIIIPSKPGYFTIWFSAILTLNQMKIQQNENKKMKKKKRTYINIYLIDNTIYLAHEIINTLTNYLRNTNFLIIFISDLNRFMFSYCPTISDQQYLSKL